MASLKTYQTWATFGLLLTFISLAPRLTWAANTPAHLDPVKWTKLITQIPLTGSLMDGPDETTWYSLTHLNPADPKQTHQADYISTIGAMDPAHQYVVFELSAVSELWTLTPEGNWDIDQWVQSLNLNLNGELTRVMHVHLVETQRGDVLTDDFLPNQGPTSPEELNRWDAKLVQWFTWTQAPSRPLMP